jgi:hypothetical protein
MIVFIESNHSIKAGSIQEQKVKWIMFLIKACTLRSVVQH